MMATKKELLREAVAAGRLPEDADEADYTAAQLEALIDPSSQPAWEGSLSADKPQVAPDGHVNLSQDDIDARQ